MRTLLLPPPLRCGPADLDPDEAHHARGVLRLGPGDPVRLADGDGAWADGEVIAIDRQRVTVRCGAPEIRPDPPAALLSVAVAPPKGDRFADLVRTLSELGVGRIIPLRCQRGERERWSGERLARIAREALKQSRRPRLLAIAEPTGLDGLDGPLVVCDPAGAPARPGAPAPTTLVIGPEGGLTDGERERLRAAGAVAARLGGGILRIETAAAAAAAVWAAAWEPAR